jgi:hypothetical protein
MKAEAPKPEEAPAAKPEDKVRAPVVSDSLAAELSSGVDEAVVELEKKRPAKEKKAKKELPEVDGQAASDESGKAKPAAGKDESADLDKAKPVEIGDSHIERAIKAGMSIADAKEFKSPAALERFCSMLEAKKADKPDGKDAKPVAHDELLNDINAIPDLDPAEYDEKVVAVFKALKGIVLRQHSTIGDMRDNQTRGEGNWFDNQIAALGDGVVDAVGKGTKEKLDPKSSQAAKRNEIEDKFSVLSAGYKAAGKPVEREAVFSEAVKLVLGDVAAKQSETEKAAVLAKRATQHISRPNGSRNAPSSDPLADVAGALDRKFFDKK